MADLVHFVAGGIIPIIIVLMAVAFLMGLKVAVSRYKKVPPGRVGIFYGMKYHDGKGFMVMSGGGRIQRPVLEGYMEADTTSFQVDIKETGIPNKDNVKLTVMGVATCKISTKPEDLAKAIEALIDKLTEKRAKGDENPIKEFSLNILKGHLRSVIGKLDINELLRDRDGFNQSVTRESGAELSTFGIELQNLVIQDIKDEQGYIDALGKQAVADALANAEIKQAEATRDQEVSVSNAKKAAAVTRAKNEAEIAEANRDRDIKQAGFLRETAKAQAEANMAGDIAKAAQEQTLKVAEAERDKAEKTAQVGVQEQELLRMTAQLQATNVANATATKQTTIIQAEAAKEKRIIDADAEAEYPEEDRPGPE